MNLGAMNDTYSNKLRKEVEKREKNEDNPFQKFKLFAKKG